MSPDTSTAPPDHPRPDHPRPDHPRPDHPRPDQQSANAVRLSGRVSAAPEARMLPSGDEVVSFRLVVPRSAAALRRSKQRVDTIECSAWTARLRRGVRRLAAGDQVTVTGELRRRFSRGASGPMSWVTVDLDTCERSASGPGTDD